MSVSGLSNNVLNYQTIGGLTFPTNPLGTSVSANAVAAVGNSQGSAASNSSTAGTNNSNNSSLSAAITQSLLQVNPNLDLTSLLSSTGQQASSDFLSNLYNVLPQLSGSGSSSSDAATQQLQSLLTSSAPQVAPAQLNASSATYSLQNGIQQLISNLNNTDSGENSIDSLFGDSSSSDDSGAFSASSLQSAFNQLISSSGGNPSQTSLQSFLQLVAVNIQGSTSIGSLFDTSA